VVRTTTSIFLPYRYGRCLRDGNPRWRRRDSCVFCIANCIHEYRIGRSRQLHESFLRVICEPAHHFCTY
jgi:hypothetical protein